MRVFHENVTLEVDLDDDGNSIIIKYDIGVKQGDTLAPVLFLCYIQAVLETLFAKFEAAGIEKLKFRSMQPKSPADDSVSEFYQPNPRSSMQERQSYASVHRLQSMHSTKMRPAPTLLPARRAL